MPALRARARARSGGTARLGPADTASPGAAGAAILESPAVGPSANMAQQDSLWKPAASAGTPVCGLSHAHAVEGMQGAAVPPRMMLVRDRL